jgi:hypothetical protein
MYFQHAQNIKAKTKLCVRQVQKWENSATLSKSDGRSGRWWFHGRSLRGRRRVRQTHFGWSDGAKHRGMRAT